MEVSFIIPAYNSEKTIANTINSILNQQLHNCDINIFVINDGSTDNTAKIASKFKKVRLLNKKHTGLGDTRNFGLRNVNSDFIVFLDSDITLDKFWLKEIIKNTDFSKYGGAMGSVTVLNKKKSAICALNEEVLRRRFKNKLETIDLTNFKMAPFQYIFKKNVFTEVGKFDPIFKTNGEDVDWFIRCFLKGYKILYVSTAKAEHTYSPPSMLSWIKKQFRTSKAFITYIKNPVPMRYKLILFIKVLFLPIIFIFFFFNPLLAFILLSLGILEEFYRGMKTLRNKKYIFLLLFGRFFSAIGQLKAVLTYIIFKRV